MSSSASSINTKDEAVLASLGYKQEFKRAFSPWEAFGIAFSIIGLLPSMAYADVFPSPMLSVAHQHTPLQRDLLVLFV